MDTLLQFMKERSLLNWNIFNTFTTKTSMYLLIKIHIVSILGKKKPYECNICDATFISSWRKEGKKPFKYNICDSSFSHKVSMDRQIASVHEWNKLFYCNNCDVNFTQKSSLNGHINAVHEGEKSLNSNTEFWNKYLLEVSWI